MSRVLVVGAGVGGLCAAIDLARQGHGVTVLERAAAVGGKMRRVPVGQGLHVDGGPTVFTMRKIFADLFADAGAKLEERLRLIPGRILARHAWRAGGRLDLFADIDRSAEAIRAFSGPADAEAYRGFCTRSRDTLEMLAATHMAAERPGPIDLMRRIGFGGFKPMSQTCPFTTLWKDLSKTFADPRLRQLFGRYATYVGSGPLKAPSTLMLIAAVEQQGVWQAEGGMAAVGDALRDLAEEKGADIRCGAHVAELTVEAGRATGAVLEDGERLTADAVVFAGDAAALASGRLGPAVTQAVPAIAPKDRSLSAVTWCLRARTRGFPLLHHSVFFAEDYPDEFKAVFDRGTPAEAPTVYICAQDRGLDDGAEIDGPERLLVLINAPADGDLRDWDGARRDDAAARCFDMLSACGLEVERDPEAETLTTPQEFDALFPATGGALYGKANHSPTATFGRPGARTAMPGLYLCGGSAHPGAGVPMAAISGRLAAERVSRDMRSEGREAARSVMLSAPVDGAWHVRSHR